jgi:hypothetical protein
VRTREVVAGFIVGTALVLVLGAYLLVSVGDVVRTAVTEPTAPTTPWPPP